MTFDIDANGIVNVSAKDKATNKEQNIRIQASSGLSDDEIDQMVKDAEANAEADKERRALAEARNQAESLVHSVEKNMSEYGDHIEGADKEAIEADLQALKDVKDGEDAALIQEKTETLTQSSMKLGEAMYKAQQAETGGGDGGGGDAGDQADGGPADDDVVDADFEEVKDDKKSA